jgi:hypothetical protein
LKKNVFKYLRKKILEHSTITEEVLEFFHSYKIECLGFTETINLPLPSPNIRFTDSLLIDKLVENPEFLKKLEQVETRKHNLKTLLD